MKTHEKVETIVNTFLRAGCKSGTFGSLVPLRGGVMEVTSDGNVFRVWRSEEGFWCIQFNQMTYVDLDLMEAVRLALLN